MFRPGAAAAQLAGLIDDRLPWLTVSAAAPDQSRLPWRWDDLLGADPAGEDPTARWREALTVSTAHQYGVPAPPAMPAAFVLQWALEVPATIGAYAAVLGPWEADLSRAALSFDLAPDHLYPCHIQIRAAAPAPADPDARLGTARAAYEALALPFAERYTPGVRLGPHQRRAMVDDVWSIAVHRARQSLRAPTSAPERGSCCFIYTLPGVHECAGCPRLRRSAPVTR